MKKILIYGDSNVWGDNFNTGVRIPDEKQWPNILQKLLGNNYKILQEGLPGRVAGNIEKEKKFKNGKDTFMSTFRTNAPIDIVIIALGTNDLQIKYDRETCNIVDDLLWYKDIIEEEFEDEDNKRKYFKDKKLPKIIYILPTHFEVINRDNPIFNDNSEAKRQQVIKSFKNNNNVKSYFFNDLELFNDGIHLNYDGHKKLAQNVENIIKEIS